MKPLAVRLAGVGLLLVAGCGTVPSVLPNDPAVIERSERWFRRTDPAVFFAQEQKQGRTYFIGIYDPSQGPDSPAPGISRNDPAYRVARTWFILTDAGADPEGMRRFPWLFAAKTNADPERDHRYLAAARDFAARYNPLVLAYFHQHPAGK